MRYIYNFIVFLCRNCPPGPEKRDQLGIRSKRKNVLARNATRDFIALSMHFQSYQSIARRHAIVEIQEYCGYPRVRSAVMVVKPWSVQPTLGRRDPHDRDCFQYLRPNCFRTKSYPIELARSRSSRIKSIGKRSDHADDSRDGILVLLHRRSSWQLSERYRISPAARFVPGEKTLFMSKLRPAD